jgi:hypothetical protein
MFEKDWKNKAQAIGRISILSKTARQKIKKVHVHRSRACRYQTMPWVITFSTALLER